MKYSLLPLLFALVLLAHSEVAGDIAAQNEKSRLALSDRINSNLKQKLDQTFGRDDSKSTSNTSKAADSVSASVTVSQPM